MNRRKFLKSAAAVSLLFPVSRLASTAPFSVLHRGENFQFIQKSAFLMGSVVTFDVYTSDKKHALKTIEKAVKRGREIEDRLTVYSPQSETGQLNQSGKKELLSASDDFMSCLKSAHYYHDLTNGLFDITIEPLMTLFGFREDESVRIDYPDDKTLARFQNCIGMKNVGIEGRSVYFNHPETKIDFGGIGCGYALEEMKAILVESGISRAMINFSGDIALLGSPPVYTGWSIEILNPKDRGRNIKLNVSDCVISTSGSYENRRSESVSKSWGHIINPKLLYPTEPLTSLSVISDSARHADALSTAGYLDSAQLQNFQTSNLIKSYHEIL